MSVRIVYENCTSCKACYNHCPNDVIGWDEEKNIPVILYQDECSHCGVCALECKFDAIKHRMPLACWLDISTFTPAVNPPKEFNWKNWAKGNK
jgi:NAD-dependent dihydropyrimidine dehydrogenase PreA subunit